MEPGRSSGFGTGTDLVQKVFEIRGVQEGPPDQIFPRGRDICKYAPIGLKIWLWIVQTHRMLKSIVQRGSIKNVSA